ncbi:MAG: potassium channel family protein [Gemmataceae bacterium]|nr:potassium channel family protein [Gemmataceae bacterium]
MTTSPDPPPDPWYARHGGVVFLAVLVLTLVTAPFANDADDSRAAEPVLVTVVLVAGVGAVGGHRWTVLAAALLAIPVVTGRWLHHARPTAVAETAYLAAGVVFAAFVAGHQMVVVFRTRRVDANVLCAGITGYLLVGLLWAVLYRLIAAATPGAFAVGPDRRELEGLEAGYFSFMTLSTVGYGDIVPVSRPARMLAVLEATTGLFYVTVLIARLVALYSSETARPHANPPGAAP